MAKKNKNSVKRGQKRNAPKKAETYPHFRRYLKANHPAMITGEHAQDEYKYRKVMHSDREGNRPNEKVDPNPNPNDPNPMYLGKRTRHDKKRNFSTWKYPWNSPKK